MPYPKSCATPLPSGNACCAVLALGRAAGRALPGGAYGRGRGRPTACSDWVLDRGAGNCVGAPCARASLQTERRHARASRLGETCRQRNGMLKCHGLVQPVDKEEHAGCKRLAMLSRLASQHFTSIRPTQSRNTYSTTQVQSKDTVPCESMLSRTFKRPEGSLQTCASDRP